MVKLLLPLSLLALLAGCDGATDGKTDKGVEDSALTPVDEDGDGWLVSEGDCDDNNSDVSPDATELCNGIDDNCNSTVDEGVLGEFYEDGDGDGFGDPGASTEACDSPSGYVGNGTDCDDSERRAFPGGTEVCDEIDNNCDGAVDEGVSTLWYADADGDGFGDLDAPTPSCERPAGSVRDATDCDDTTSNAFPGNAEVCDEIDNNCDGTVDEGVTTTYYADFDGDRFGNSSLTQEACAVPTGYTTNETDCDDAVAAVNPDATELCNSIDDDCDGALDNGFDSDADGIADCYDTEMCDGLDNDGDGVVDEDDAVDASTWYLDADEDGYGNSSRTDVQCSQPDGFVADGTDCVDSSAITHPGADEICDSIDNDCDGIVDNDPVDGTTWYVDTDGDGYGDPSVTETECAQPDGYVDNDHDCVDTDRTEPVVADPISGSAAGSGTLASPYDSLQDAIDAANLCVVAYSGTYREQIDLGGKSIDVWGIEGFDVTTIDPNLATCTSTDPTACGAAVTIDSRTGAYPTLHGFTITGGTGAYTTATTTTTCADSSASHTGTNTCTVTSYEYCGGGVYVNGDDPIFYDVDIRDNNLPAFQQISSGSFNQIWMYSYGGGVCLQDSNARFEDAWIAGNFADQGGGVFAESGSNFTFEHGYVGDNDAVDGGGVNLSGAYASFTNAAVYCNRADTDGGGLFTESSGTSTFTNTVFFGNTSSTTGPARGSQVYVGTSTTFNLLNSIVEASTTVPLLYGAGGTGSQLYNNVYNSAGGTYDGSITAGTGAISSGSNFSSGACEGNPYNDTFALRTSSSSVDAGDPSGASNDPDGSRNDMGARGGPGGTW